MIVVSFHLLFLFFVIQSTWIICLTYFICGFTDIGLINTLVFALFYGLTDIATIAPFTMLCSKIFGIKQMGSAFGMISFFHQVGAAVGSFIPGLLFSLSAEYHSALWICVIILCLNVVILLKLKGTTSQAIVILSEGKMIDR